MSEQQKINQFEDIGLAPPNFIKRDSKVYLFLKRLMDIVFSVAAIIILLPLFIIVAVIIKLDSKGPVLFIQKRCGKDGKIFKMYKFRSMCMDAEEKLDQIHHLNDVEEPLFKIKDDPRLTRVGRFLRRTSIDELPQLINIIKGDMSLVGPRPPLPSEVEKYNSWQKLRLSVKPGLTGLWQISGRSNLGFDEMVRLDLKYIAERNLVYDIKIIIKTIPAVLKFYGAY